MLIDLHVHVGPRGLAPGAVLERARAVKLDGVVLVGDGAFPAPPEGSGPVRVFSAAEVATDRGHYLVFLPRPAELPALDEVFGPRGERGWAVRDVLARCDALGGAVVAAHPYDNETRPAGGDILYTLRQLTAIEAVNGERGYGIAGPALEAADTLGLPCVGGSDAREDPDDVGRAATLFARPIEDEIALIEALRSGSCWPVECGTPSFQPGSSRGGPPSGARDGGGGRRRRRGR
jgi:hypothetical protein